MRKIIPIILILSLTFGCRTRRATKFKSKEVQRVDYTQKQTESLKEAKKDIIEVVKKDNTSDIIKKANTDIQIKAKIDKENPLTLYDIINGDTLSSFKVIGNAEVIFNSSRSDSNVVKAKTTETTNSKTTENNKESEGVISGAINTAKEIQNSTVEVVAKGFNFMTYAVFFLWGLGAIAVLGLIIYLRKINIVGKITNFFKK